MKEVTVKLGGQDVKISSSGYLVVLYADLFGSNVFEDFGRIVKSVAETQQIPYSEMTTLFKLAYAMAKHSDSELMPYEDWLRAIDVYDIPNIANEIIDLWAADTENQSTP